MQVQTESCHIDRISEVKTVREVDNPSPSHVQVKTVREADNPLVASPSHVPTDILLYFPTLQSSNKTSNTTNQ